MEDNKKYVLYKENLNISMNENYRYWGRYQKPGCDVINDKIHDFFPIELATFKTEEEVKKELSKYKSSFSYKNNTAKFDLYYYEEQNEDGELDGDQVGADNDKVFYIAYYMNLKDAIDYNKNLEVTEELEEDIEWKKQNGWSADDLENDIRFLQGIKDDIQDIEERYNRSKKIAEDWKDYWKELHENQEANKENESSDDMEL